MPWRGPLGGDPLESVPGPDNPWLACVGVDRADREAMLRGETSVNALQLPEFALPQEGDTGIDWTKISVGLGLTCASVLVIVAAVNGALATAASLPATAAGTPASTQVAVIGAYLAGGGVVLMAAGSATIMAAIDPKVSDYKKHVPAVPMRKLALSGDLPAPVATFMQSVAELERLSTAETDIIDHARAAAKANDKSWTELHLRDLYHVQNAKQHFVGELSGALGQINAAFGSKFDQHRVDPEELLRDMINPLIEMRSALNEVASISNAELNAVLQTVRVPSPMGEAINATVRAMANEAQGQPSRMVNMAVQQLERIDVVDREAFGLNAQ